MIARRPRLAAAPFLGLAGLSVPAAAGEADDVLLRIEAPAAALDAIHGAVARLAEPAPEHAAMAAAAVKEAFDGRETLEAVRGAVEGAGADPVETADLAAAAGRFEAAAAAWDAPGKVEEARLAELKTRFEARADRERIVELAELMALPELRGEVALATARIERMLALPGEVGIERLREAGPAELAEEARRFVAESRASGGESAAHPSRELAVSEGQDWATVRLALLDEADIAALHAFYASAQGRAKRDALVSSFAARNDADAEAMLLAFVEALRARAG